MDNDDLQEKLRLLRAEQFRVLRPKYGKAAPPLIAQAIEAKRRELERYEADKYARELAAQRGVPRQFPPLPKGASHRQQEERAQLMTISDSALAWRIVAQRVQLDALGALLGEAITRGGRAQARAEAEAGDAARIADA